MRQANIEEIGEERIRAAFIAHADKYFDRKVPYELKALLLSIDLDGFMGVMFDLHGKLYFDLEVDGESIRFADARASVAGSA